MPMTAIGTWTGGSLRTPGKTEKNDSAQSRTRDRTSTPEASTQAEYDEAGHKLPRRVVTAARRQARADRKAAQAKAKRDRQQSAATRAHDAAETLRQDIFVNRTDTVDVDFDAVAVDLDDGNQHRKITPTTDFTKFNYVLGRGYVSDKTFYDQAETTIRELLPSIRTLPLSETTPIQ
jgi:hypothetical protein